MIKKYLILLLFSEVLFTASCGSDKPQGISLDIIGSFKAAKLGQAIKKTGISLPVIFTFSGDMKFKLELTSYGKKLSYFGVYKIDSAKKPAVIKIKRSDAKAFHGIIVFLSRNKFKLLLYNEDFFPLPVSFNEDEEQVFIRVF
jgi:hypothetical protein